VRLGRPTICPRPTLTFDLEVGVGVACDLGYPCAKLRLPRPFGFRVRADVHDIRRTDRRTTDADHRIMPPRRGHNNESADRYFHVGYLSWVIYLCSALCTLKPKKPKKNSKKPRFFQPWYSNYFKIVGYRLHLWFIAQNVEITNFFLYKKLLYFLNNYIFCDMCT